MSSDYLEKSMVLIILPYQVIRRTVQDVTIFMYELSAKKDFMVLFKVALCLQCVYIYVCVYMVVFW